MRMNFLLCITNTLKMRRLQELRTEYRPTMETTSESGAANEIRSVDSHCISARNSQGEGGPAPGGTTGLLVDDTIVAMLEAAHDLGRARTSTGHVHRNQTHVPAIMPTSIHVDGSEVRYYR